MLRLWLLLVLVVTSQLSYGQLKSNISALNYGKVEVWKNDTLYIEIKNRSNTPAELLPTYNPKC